MSEHTPLPRRPRPQPLAAALNWWRSHTPRERLRAGLLGLGLLIGAFLIYLLSLIPLTPSVADLKQAQTMKPSVLLTADGKTLLTFSRQQRELVTLDQVSPHVVKALIATEDRRFYDHKGLDLKRTLSAAWHTLSGDRQGGSTITQQLARNLFPEDIGRARNLHRKFKEIITALRIERVYTKEQILEAYLNNTPFLYNAVGIEMAARTYFDKPAKSLNEAEAATLVGMLKGTHYYNPVLYPERAHKRRNLVLQQMVKLGALDEDRYERLAKQPLKVKFNRQDETSELAPHFAEQAKRWLLEWAEAHDIDLYTEGLTIETTLDSRLQAAAMKAVQRQADLLQQVADVEWAQPGLRLAYSPESYAAARRSVTPFAHFFNQRPELLASFLKETPEYKALREQGVDEAAALKQLRADAKVVARVREQHTRLEAGFLAMDPQTGEIKAWVGSRNFADDQFDHVAQAARQPGSTFKAVVYAAALESGIGPTRAYLDGPVEVRLDARTVWRPTDMSGYSGRMMSLRDGLVYSKNTITAQVSQEVGLSRIVSLAQAMGVDRSRLEPVPSLALGTSPVTLLEMVNVYATIAAQGTRHKPLFIRRITDREGGVLAEFVSESQRALSPETSVDLIDMLRGVVTMGTGASVKANFGVNADVAGKTGTTQNNTDGWFIMMHPHLVAGAWVGFNDQRVTMRSDHWGQGGRNALRLVGDFFRETMRARLVDTAVAFPPPRRPPVYTAYTPPPETVEESAGTWIPADVEDGEVVPGSPTDGRTTATASTTIPGSITITTSGSGTTMAGDAAGIEAMRRNTTPPKSAEELDRALGRLLRPGEARADNTADGSGATGSTSGSTSTSGTEGYRPRASGATTGAAASGGVTPAGAVVVVPRSEPAARPSSGLQDVLPGRPSRAAPSGTPSSEAVTMQPEPVPPPAPGGTTD